jgi:hypothetical protein
VCLSYVCICMCHTREFSAILRLRLASRAQLLTTEFVRPFNTCKRDLLTRKCDVLLNETYLHNTAVDNRVRVALSSTLFPKDAGGATPVKENLLVQVCACAHASTYAHTLAFRCCVVYVCLYYTYTNTHTRTHTYTHTHTNTHSHTLIANLG